MPKIVGHLSKYPARATLVWYLALTVGGTAVLSLPVCCQNEQQPISISEAAFTATSAVCVTGLTVRSTPNDFSFWGQLVILFLIQVGGIGIMTITTYVVLQLGSNETMWHVVAVREAFGGNIEIDLRRLLSRVILIVVAAEAMGFVVLAAHGINGDSRAGPVWQALFHSISAFCNAGFSLHDDSLIRARLDPVVNATLIALIVTGGLGFPVIVDLFGRFVPRRQQPGRADATAETFTRRRLHVHTKLVLLATSLLLLLGTIAFLFFERDNVLAKLSPSQQLLVAAFHSTTTRTAGFSTVSVAALAPATLAVTMSLMTIGVGPCSTGGGLKVSTFMVLVLYAWNSFRGSKSVSAFGRTIPRQAVDRACIVFLLLGAALFGGLVTILAAEQTVAGDPGAAFSFLDISFEVTSALGTVGLSTGVTPQLSLTSRAVLMALMFVGRLGPISLIIALSAEGKKRRLKFPDEDVLVG